MAGKENRKSFWIRTVRVELEKPSLKNNTADVERLKEGLVRAVEGDPVRISRAWWTRLPGLLREAEFRVSASLGWRGSGWEVLDLEAGAASGSYYGAALDLGTTTLVCSLVDLGSGRMVAEKQVPNPQGEVGPDILTRIQFAVSEGGLDTLRDRVRDGLNAAVRAACSECGVDSRRVVLAAVAGNTTMTHFFLGLDPSWIRKEPYIPVVNRPGWIPARELDLAVHPCARAFLFPNVGSYFGGDLISGILASGMHRSEAVCLLVDVGTNAEVVVGNSDWLLACAGAAGPALEGGVARMGMTAGAGAIDHVRIDPKTWDAEVSVMGGGAPVGICGSGLIDLVAELFAAGLIDQRGKIRSVKHPRVVETDSGRAYVVVPGSRTAHGEDILLTQVDLDILLRSKAAMYTILTTLLEEVGLSFRDIHRFYVAGTFGTYIDPVMAIRIGMIPDLPLDTYVSLGNSSLAGARLLLGDRERMEEVEEIARRITYLELNVNQRFMSMFSAAKFIPHTDPNLFPSVFGKGSGNGPARRLFP